MWWPLPESPALRMQFSPFLKALLPHTTLHRPTQRQNELFCRTEGIPPQAAPLGSPVCTSAPDRTSACLRMPGLSPETLAPPTHTLQKDMGHQLMRTGALFGAVHQCPLQCPAPRGLTWQPSGEGGESVRRVTWDKARSKPRSPTGAPLYSRCLPRSYGHSLSQHTPWKRSHSQQTQDESGLHLHRHRRGAPSCSLPSESIMSHGQLGPRSLFTPTPFKPHQLCPVLKQLVVRTQEPVDVVNPEKELLESCSNGVNVTRRNLFSGSVIWNIY